MKYINWMEIIYSFNQQAQVDEIIEIIKNHHEIKEKYPSIDLSTFNEKLNDRIRVIKGNA